MNPIKGFDRNQAILIPETIEELVDKHNLVLDLNKCTKTRLKA
jgi:hypothetical protein